jgi:hypothetical protein
MMRTLVRVVDGIGSRTRLTDVAVKWTDTLPTASRIETSLDGSSWGPLRPNASARYVRVTLTRDAAAGRTGIREVVATAK